MIQRVYFYCREGHTAFQDDVVMLADGLQAIGIEVYGNCNYWLRSTRADDWLVRHVPDIGPDDCDLVVVSGGWSRWIDDRFRVHESPLPAGLFSNGRRYRTAYLDYDDGYETHSWRPEFRNFDAIFRTKYNQRCEHPTNHHPWALGLHTRVLNLMTKVPSWSERNQDLLVNFNASHPYIHSARALAGPPFVAAAASLFKINDRRDDLTLPPADPYDRLMWEQTQKRHSPSYYERLRTSQAIVAFCGEIIPPAPYHPPYLVGGRKAKISRKFYDLLAHFDPRPSRLIQWDSWRFWEGLAAGCLVFNLDLPHYGVLLPVMPEPFVHYVPIQPENARQAIQRLQDTPGLAERIADQGRAWALEHYSALPLARRFLEMMARCRSS